MGDFYIIFYSVVVGIIASEASEKKKNKNPWAGRVGPLHKWHSSGGGVVHPNIFSSVLDKSQKWPLGQVGGGLNPQTPRGLATVYLIE